MSEIKLRQFDQNVRISKLARAANHGVALKPILSSSNIVTSTNQPRYNFVSDGQHTYAYAYNHDQIGNGTVINPLTGRKIQVGGKTYNKIFNQKGKSQRKKKNSET